MMGTPHKHAAVIKAWADGAEIEWCCVEHDVMWSACPHPNWNENFQYRVKLPTLRYRVALYKVHRPPIVDLTVYLAEANNSAGENNYDQLWPTDRNFIRWLTDWTEAKP